VLGPNNLISNMPDRNSVEITWLTLDRIGPDDWRKLERMLDAGERERADRYRFERDRNTYVAAHALLRGMLSRVVAHHPSNWRFATNAHGKPDLVRHAGVPPLRFNISHTRGLVAVALTIENDVGLDVEILDAGRVSMDLALRFFAAPEVDYLRRLPAERQQTEFYSLWTLKEAYIKAIGLGFSVPLDAFSFALEPLAISFSQRRPDSSANWLFRRFQPSPLHTMALALRHTEPHRVGVKIKPAPFEVLLAQSDHAAGPVKISRRE
jgi:4'-phosphopantetheinyl transferase